MYRTGRICFSTERRVHVDSLLDWQACKYTDLLHCLTYIIKLPSHESLWKSAVLRIRILCLFDPGIRDRFFFPGSRIPDPQPIFLELNENILDKKYYNSL
jgi:hypothetical protein